MSLLQTIREHQLQARKDRATVKATLLTTLIGEAAAIGKSDGNRPTTDQEVIACIQKFMRNNLDTLKAPSLPVANYVQLVAENEILESFLPRQLSELELKGVIADIVHSTGASSMKDMKVVMAELNANYAGMYANQAASEIVRKLLSPPALTNS